MPRSHGSIWGKYFPAQLFGQIIILLTFCRSWSDVTWCEATGYVGGCRQRGIWVPYATSFYMSLRTPDHSRRRASGQSSPWKPGHEAVPWRHAADTVRPVARALALRVGQRSWAASTTTATGNDHCGRARRGSAACVARVWRRIW